MYRSRDERVSKCSRGGREGNWRVRGSMEDGRDGGRVGVSENGHWRGGDTLLGAGLMVVRRGFDRRAAVIAVSPRWRHGDRITGDSRLGGDEDGPCDLCRRRGLVDVGELALRRRAKRRKRCQAWVVHVVNASHVLLPNQVETMSAVLFLTKADKTHKSFSLL